MRYEVGFSADVSWQEQHKTEDHCSIDFLVQHLNNKISAIVTESGCSDYELYMTSNDVKGKRFFVGQTKPYKGNRVPNKPYHYNNLTVLMHADNAIEVEEIEADDAIATRQCEGGDTVICSRDKDFKQVPGVLYSWELGRQPSFGPKEITMEEGLHFFFYQLLVGDSADNIPGLPGKGKAFANKHLKGTPFDKWMFVQDTYKSVMGGAWTDLMEEQATLLWLHRKPGEWWSWDVMEECIGNA